MDLPREQIAKGVKASVLRANEKALNEWNKKYERLGDALEEAFRVRGFRIDSREMGLIHAVAESDSGIAIFVCEPGYERLLEGLQTLGQFTRSYPQIRKSVWDELFELIPWMDPYWGPLPLPYYLTQSIQEPVMTVKSLEDDMKELRNDAKKILEHLSKTNERLAGLEEAQKHLATKTEIEATKTEIANTRTAISNVKVWVLGLGFSSLFTVVVGIIIAVVRWALSGN